MGGRNNGNGQVVRALERCANLLFLFQEKGALTRTEFEKSFGGDYSERTWKRDIQTLREAGTIISVRYQGEDVVYVYGGLARRVPSRARKKR